MVEQPNRKRILVQATLSGSTARKAVEREFGGSSQTLGRDWLAKFSRVERTKPLRIGGRLTVVSETGGEGRLVIPAGAAFGTGEHATTAMSLRMLERITRRLPAGWSMLDVGTGSGILALAGKRFDAGEVIAIDNDPLAIRTARGNAELNGIRGVQCMFGDVHESPTSPFEIITANLYSELLESALPRFRRCLKADGRLILSGVMRNQEAKLARALRFEGLAIVETRRRGKWVALLAAHRQKRS